MNFIFASPDAVSQAFYPILVISLCLTLLVCTIVYKAFGVNKTATVVAGVLMMIASTTFSSFNLSTIFHRLQLVDGKVILDFSFPYQQTLSQPFEQFRYVDAITPDSKNPIYCHLVLEDIQGMLYQSVDIAASDCERIQQQIASQLQLKPRPVKPKSRHAPPLPPEPSTTTPR